MKSFFQKISQLVSGSLVALAAMLLPVAVWAQTTPAPAATASTGCTMTVKTLKSLLQYPVCIINRYVLPLLVAIAFGAFFLGIVRYLFNLENQEKRQEMRYFIMWSAVALFVILSVWGIILLMQNTLRLPQ